MSPPTPATAAFVIHAKGLDTLRAPLLLGLPAMGTPARYYEPLAHALAQACGASVAWAELRGQGSHPQRARAGADFGYREIVEHDIPALAGQLRAEHPGRPLYLLGHSLGGQLGSLAAHQISGLAGVVLVATGTAHFRAWPSGQRARAWLTVSAIRMAATLLPWYPGHKLGFGGEQPRRLMRDWTRNAFTGRYAIEGSQIDHEAAMRALRVPVLSLTVDGDPFAPPSAADALLGKLAAADITRLSIGGVPGHSPRRRHFSWARQPDEAADRVAHWLRHARPTTASSTLPHWSRHVLA
jgi:predicted alpha/beta hydrolase